METEEKLHTLTISNYNPQTHTFNYTFTCPGFNETEHKPCGMSIPCRKCATLEIDDDGYDTFILHGQEHFKLDGEWSIPLENTCVAQNYPDRVNDQDLDEISRNHGNGTYLVDLEPDPYLQPATWNIEYKTTIN